MKKLRESLLFLVLLSFGCRCSGADSTNRVIAIWDWSQPTQADRAGASGALRGRLLILQGHSAGYGGDLPETLVYLELQNVTTGVGEPISLYFDPKNGLEAELKNAKGVSAPEGFPGNGGFPNSCWLTIPYDSTERLRVSWYAHGTPREGGLYIPIFKPLMIRAGDTNDYFLTAKFVSVPPTNRTEMVGREIWQGRLLLPPLKVVGLRP